MGIIRTWYSIIRCAAMKLHQIRLCFVSTWNFVRVVSNYHPACLCLFVYSCLFFRLTCLMPLVWLVLPVWPPRCSSQAEAEDVSSSSDDERRSLSPLGFDTGGGVAVLCRDPSTPARAEHVPAKPSMDGFSPLSSFDLPPEALQDRVSFIYLLLSQRLVGAAVAAMCCA